MDLHFEDSTFNSLHRFEKMLKTDSVFFFDSLEFEEIIAYYIDHGKIFLAKKALDLAVSQYPKSIDINVLRCEVLIAEHKLNEAEMLLDDLFIIDPDNEEIYIQKARLLSKQNDHEMAIDYLLVALDMIDSEYHIDIFFMLGSEYLLLEKHSIARNYFEKCLALDPTDTQLIHNIIYCFDMDKAHVEAITFLEAFIDLHPYHEIAWHQLGKENYILGRYFEALDAFDYAILIDEKFSGAYVEKAKTLEKLQQFSQAVQCYKIAATMEDPMSFAYLRMGYCYAKLSDVDQALESYQKALNLDPNREEPLIAIIELLIKQHRYHEILSYVQQLISIDDTNVKYFKLYGDINMKNALFYKAVDCYKKCIILGDNKLDVFLRLADALYYIGDYQKAINVLQDAELLFTQHYKITIRLSGLYFLKEDYEQGLKFFKYFHQVKPNGVRLFRRLFPAVFNKKAIQCLLSNHQLIE